MVGYARRAVFVPMPQVDCWEELNASLAERCDRYKKRHIRGMDLSVAELFEAERKLLLPLPVMPYEAVLVKTLKVDHFSTIGIDGNRYSVPVEHAGRHVTAKLSAFRLEVSYRGEKIASHSRCFEKKCTIYELGHYIPLQEASLRQQRRTCSGTRGPAAAA